MEMIKFCMQVLIIIFILFTALKFTNIFIQDTLRYLVLSSLNSFNQMIQDACYQVIGCDTDMVWENSLLLSDYKPKRYPLFVIDLIIGDFSSCILE